MNVTVIFLLYQEVDAPETVKGVESRCLPIPIFYTVMLLELLLSFLKYLKGTVCGWEGRDLCDWQQGCG